MPIGMLVFIRMGRKYCACSFRFHPTMAEGK